MKLLIVSLAALLLNTVAASAQTVEPPAPGKAVVYFVRPSGLGLLINFSYYDSAKFIGKYNGPKYMRYECKPGKHLFWATSENRDFIDAELEEGKIYMIEAVPQMGAVKAGVKLVPVNPKDPKQMGRIRKLMSKKTAETFTQDELDRETLNSKSSIESGIEKYKKEKEKGTNNKIGILRKEDFATL